MTQLFNSIDPSPLRQKDLDLKAEEFIVGWAREARHDTQFALLVYVDQPGGPEDANVLRDAVRELRPPERDARGNRRGAQRAADLKVGGSIAEGRRLHCGDDGRVTHESTAEFLQRYLAELRAVVARVYLVLPRNAWPLTLVARSARPSVPIRPAATATAAGPESAVFPHARW